MEEVREGIWNEWEPKHRLMRGTQKLTDEDDCNVCVQKHKD